jgi:hypothetical protein
MPIAGTSHLTKPNSAFEAQSELTVAGMYHFAVPGGPSCGTCISYGPKDGPRKNTRHRCRKAWGANSKVKAGFYGDQTGCKYHTARPPKVKKARGRKSTVAA